MRSLKINGGQKRGTDFKEAKRNSLAQPLRGTNRRFSWNK